MPAYCAKGSGMGGRRPGGEAAEAGEARLPARRAGGLRPPPSSCTNKALSSNR